MANNKIIDLNALGRFKTNCDTEYQATLVSGTNIKTINNTTLLGSGNYAFDSAFNELSTNALENQVVAKEFREVYYEIAMIREALFEVVLSEIDYSVDYAMTYLVPDTLTDNDGTHRVVYSETQLVSVSGNSVVDNQLAQNGNFDDTSGYYTYVDATLSVSNNIGTFTLTGTTNVARFGQGGWTYKNHYYLIVMTAKTNSSGDIYARLWSNGWEGSRELLSSNWKKVVRYVQKTTNDSQMIDYPFSFDTSGGSAGDTINVKECMIIDTTQIFGAGNEPTTTDDVRIQWLLSRGYIAYNTGSLLSTSVSGLESKDSSDNTLSTITLPTTELKSAGSVHDYLEIVESNVVEGEQRYNLVKTSNVVSVNLGTFDYSRSSSGSVYYFYISLTDSVVGVLNEKANILCPIYETKTTLAGAGTSLDTDMSMYLSNNGVSLRIRNDTYTSTTTFKTAMNGVYLQYKLATPVQTTIATDLTFEQVSLIIQQGGTINSNFTNVPPNVTTTFVVKKAVGE